MKVGKTMEEMQTFNSSHHHASSLYPAIPSRPGCGFKILFLHFKLDTLPPLISKVDSFIHPCEVGIVDSMAASGP